MWPNPQETGDLVTFTQEILNGKLHFLCIVKTVCPKTILIKCFLQLSEVIWKKKIFCVWKTSVPLASFTRTCISSFSKKAACKISKINNQNLWDLIFRVTPTTCSVTTMNVIHLFPSRVPSKLKDQYCQYFGDKLCINHESSIIKHKLKLDLWLQAMYIKVKYLSSEAATGCVL